jgi:hypothetical protein
LRCGTDRAARKHTEDRAQLIWAAGREGKDTRY